MVQTLTNFVSFEEFIQVYAETGSRYDLHNGEIVEMNRLVGDHEFVIGFLVRKISGELDRFNLSYLITKTTFIKSAKSESAYLPDILLLNPANLILLTYLMNLCGKKNQPLLKLLQFL
ncbi:MAG: Uma2 family endonuclease [Dolichospermum sp.]